MKCKSCGRDIMDNSVFCNWCGEKQIKERKKKEEIRVPKARQLPSGSWTIQLRAEGVSITEATESMCITKARAIRAGFLAQQKELPSKTLGEAVDAYIASRSNVLSPSTLRGYQTIRQNRFQAVMDSPISAVSDWQNEINRESRLCSPKTLRNSWGFLSSVLRENGVSIPLNVRLPQLTSSPRPWLNYQEILTFVDAVHGAPCEIAALLALHSLRRSEIMALTWDKIDLSAGTITVSGSAVYNEDNMLVQKSTNKNRSSRRVVPIMIPELKNALLSSCPKDKKECLISCNPNTIWSQINRVCKKNGLPLVGVHGLRHSFASLAHHLGMQETEAMAIGGWSDYLTMHRIYTHLDETDRISAENKMSLFYQNRDKDNE